MVSDHPATAVFLWDGVDAYASESCQGSNAVGAVDGRPVSFGAVESDERNIKVLCKQAEYVVSADCHSGVGRIRQNLRQEEEFGQTSYRAPCASSTTVNASTPWCAVGSGDQSGPPRLNVANAGPALTAPALMTAITATYRRGKLTPWGSRLAAYIDLTPPHPVVL